MTTTWPEAAPAGRQVQWVCPADAPLRPPAGHRVPPTTREEAGWGRPTRGRRAGIGRHPGSWARHLRLEPPSANWGVPIGPLVRRTDPLTYTADHRPVRTLGLGHPRSAVRQTPNSPAPATSWPSKAIRFRGVPRSEVHPRLLREGGERYGRTPYLPSYGTAFYGAATDVVQDVGHGRLTATLRHHCLTAEPRHTLTRWGPPTNGTAYCAPRESPPGGPLRTTTAAWATAGPLVTLTWKNTG